MAGQFRASDRVASRSRRGVAAPLAVGFLAATALAAVAASVNTGSNPGSVTIDTISSGSRSAQSGTGAATGSEHSGHVLPANRGSAEGESAGGEAAAPAPSPSSSLEILASTCDNTKLEIHDGFQAGNKCVTTQFGEVGSTPNNPTLIISAAPRQVAAGKAFKIKVSTRNLVRDRFLAAAQGGYYKESSLLNEKSLQRGHFHTACRMLESRTLAPDPAAGSVFFKATEDGGGDTAPDVVTIDVPNGLPTKGLAECAAWAGDGSHRIPMMESVQAIPAFDTVRIWVR